MSLTPEHKEKVFQLFGDLSEYFRLLRKESDRGCAMIVAAHLDDKLGELLKACMIQEKENEEEISRFFKGTEPIGSFSARIKLARYLNIISPHVRSDLDTIRNIRNDFAHKLEFEDFNTQSIKDRCMNLQHDLLENNKNPRERFINAANVLIVFIDFFRDNSPGFGLALHPREVEIALMKDILNAAARVQTSKEEPQ
jgi:hypothetical protein